MISLEPSISYTKYAEQAARHAYPSRVLVAVDQMLNVVSGGSLDDTISSRMQRWQSRAQDSNPIKRAAGKFMCGWLGLIQKHHDVLANIGDRERAEAELARTTTTLQDSGVRLP